MRVSQKSVLDDTSKPRKLDQLPSMEPEGMGDLRKGTERRRGGLLALKLLDVLVFEVRAFSEFLLCQTAPLSENAQPPGEIALDAHFSVMSSQVRAEHLLSGVFSSGYILGGMRNSHASLTNGDSFCLKIVMGAELK